MPAPGRTHSPPRRRAHSILVAASMALLAGCERPAVEWTSRHTVPVGTFVAALDADGSVATDSMATLATVIAPPAPACPGSLRLARAGAQLHAAWWSVRPDSGARLLAAHSADGGAHWSTVAQIDTTDRGVSGCNRDPPSIAADSRSGYVHVSYGLVAPEGPGIFFAHSMDGGVTFHSPVAIVYGEHPGRASVASDGDVVAVAFEQPDEMPPRIGLALSRTMGHIFERRVMPVSDGNGTASRPIVAVRGSRIAIAWEQRATETARPVLVVRAGTLR